MNFLFLMMEDDTRFVGGMNRERDRESQPSLSRHSCLCLDVFSGAGGGQRFTVIDANDWREFINSITIKE